ncbi:MAG TPA: glycosyltransferase family A protein [Candidatus Solibacter sp.]|nr:glycosyltransferase family A protein [Candidatus Solibacter sp.]
MTLSCTGKNRIDLIMPVYNEEDTLPDVLSSLTRQADMDGRPLPDGALRVVAVDNASTDRSRSLLESWAGEAASPEVFILEEPEKGVVAARARGGRFSLEELDGTLMVHTDSDSVFPPTFIANVLSRFSANNVDVVSYLGFEPTCFWRRVPDLARRQFEEVGSISFSRETLGALGFDERRALFTSQIYADFENVPTQCGLAMTKSHYRRVGGYVREFNRDGTERLGEARNLTFRLDRLGARFGHVLSPPVDVNPRRYLFEAKDLWAGRSYTQGMTDLRGSVSEEHYRALDRSAGQLDYETARRNFVQRYIVDPCIARPERIRQHPQYFGPSAQPLLERILDAHASRNAVFYSEVRPLSDELVDAHCRTIIDQVRKMRFLI